MKELSNEELIYKLIGAVENEIGQALHSIDDNHVIWAYKAELLSRLNRLEEAEKQVENLKCCGNCKLYGEKDCFAMVVIETDNCEPMVVIPKQYPSNGYCDNWQSDNLTREERK